MKCSICNDKIDHSETFKVNCNDCKSYCHCACVKILPSDFEYMVSNNKHFRCDRCSALRRKSLQHHPAAMAVPPAAASQSHGSSTTLRLFYEEIMCLKKINADFLNNVIELEEENAKLRSRVTSLENTLKCKEQKQLHDGIENVDVSQMAHRHRDLFSKESTLIQESQRTLDNGLEKDPIEKLRLLCFSKGSTGILELSRILRKLDEDGLNGIQLEEFTDALTKSGLDCTETDVKEMFESFDEDGSGILNVSSILEKLRPVVHQSRLHIIAKAFDKIDTDHTGVISVSDLKHVYSVKVHPKYESGEMSESEIWKEFLENFQNPANKGDTISREEFLNFYTSMSASIDNDAYFDLLIRQAYAL